LAFKFSPDKGELLENAVFKHLKRRKKERIQYNGYPLLSMGLGGLITILKKMKEGIGDNYRARAVKS
jgi:predicted AAA+ superfamily ATPase